MVSFLFASQAFAGYGATEEPAGEPAITVPAKATGKWAHPRYRSKIHKTASEDAKTKGRMKLLTEDGFPEVYKVIRTKTVDGVVWVKIGLPRRPNGQTGWVKEGQLGEIHKSYKVLRISRRSFMARLFENKPNGKRKLIWQARVGVGAPGTETPGGNFWIRERIKGFQTGTIYGYMAFGTSAYSKLSDWPGGGVVGIHGTNQPELLPGAVSHGCVRVRNKKIYKLSKRLQIGTPVRIR